MAGERQQGVFIVLEGIDGCGSTTHAKLLAEALRARGREVVLTHEPSSGPVGQLIRQALQPGGPRFDWATMALLFAADRRNHLTTTILPALRYGATVISDRYDLSSLTYQSVTAPVGEYVVPWIRELNARATRPDLTIVIDVPAEVAKERRRSRGGDEELFEKRELQARMADVYARAEELVPRDILVHVSGVGEKSEVAARVLEAALRLSLVLVTL